MRNFTAVDSNIRTKFTYDDQQHLDPIAEFEDELDLEYGADEEAYDNETVDEEEYQYCDNDQYVIENRKRYIKPVKSREAHLQPTRAKYIYKKKEVESSSDRPMHRKSSASAKMPLACPISPVPSKSKVEQQRWSKPLNSASSFQRVAGGSKKMDRPMNVLNALREKMFVNLPGLSKTVNPSALEVSSRVPPLQSTKPKRRQNVATEQIHHDSGDGPRVSDSYKMDLADLLKMSDEASFGAGATDNETVANLVNEINTMQMENIQKMNDMERQKQETENRFYPTSLNLEHFRKQIVDRKFASEQQQSSSSGYQPYRNAEMGQYSQNFMDVNYPVKKHSSTQTNLGVEYSSEQVYHQESELKYDEACGQDDNENQNWPVDEVNHMVSSNKEDLSELRNLHKTKQMICELINKEIEKIAKMKNLDMSVSRRFLAREHESSCSQDFRKTRLDTLNNLQNEIKKLITLETVEE